MAVLARRLVLFLVALPGDLLLEGFLQLTAVQQLTAVAAPRAVYPGRLLLSCAAARLEERAPLSVSPSQPPFSGLAQVLHWGWWCPGGL